MGAVSEGFLETVEVLLKTAKINAHDEGINAHDEGINAQDNKGRTALMLAVSERNLETMEVLLKAAKINAHDEGRTALMRDVSGGNLEMVKALLKANARIDVKDKEGRTAAQIANQFGHGDIEKAIKKRGSAVQKLFDLGKLKLQKIMKKREEKN